MAADHYVKGLGGVVVVIFAMFLFPKLTGGGVEHLTTRYEGGGGGSNVTSLFLIPPHKDAVSHHGLLFAFPAVTPQFTSLKVRPAATTHGCHCVRRLFRALNR